MVLNSFIEWAGQGVLVEDVNRKKAGEYVTQLLAPDNGLSRKTVQRYVSSLSSMWTWLAARGFVEGNPWRGHAIGRKTKRGEASKRRQWNDDALKRIIQGAYTDRYTLLLHDLIRLALVTGARLEELCALKTSDVQKRGRLVDQYSRG